MASTGLRMANRHQKGRDQYHNAKIGFVGQAFLEPVNLHISNLIYKLNHKTLTVGLLANAKVV